MPHSPVYITHTAPSCSIHRGLRVDAQRRIGFGILMMGHLAQVHEAGGQPLRIAGIDGMAKLHKAQEPLCIRSYNCRPRSHTLPLLSCTEQAQARSFGPRTIISRVQTPRNRAHLSVPCAEAEQFRLQICGGFSMLAPETLCHLACGAPGCNRPCDPHGCKMCLWHLCPTSRDIR
jgi:hypothetical protein